MSSCQLSNRETGTRELLSSEMCPLMPHPSNSKNSSFRRSSLSRRSGSDQFALTKTRRSLNALRLLLATSTKLKRIIRMVTCFLKTRLLLPRHAKPLTRKFSRAITSVWTPHLALIALLREELTKTLRWKLEATTSTLPFSLETCLSLLERKRCVGTSKSVGRSRMLES